MLAAPFIEFRLSKRSDPEYVSCFVTGPGTAAGPTGIQVHHRAATSARCVARALSGEILWNLITYNLILCVCLSPYLQFDPHDNSESPSQMKRLRFRVVR